MKGHTKNFVVILLYMVFVLGFAQAATTGTLVLRGYVPERREVNVMTEGLQTIAFQEDGSRAIVGTIEENSTRKTGFKVGIASTNAAGASSDTAYLIGSDPDMRIDYSILYAGEPLALTDGQAVLDRAGELEIYCGPNGSTGMFSDTLTLSVTAN